MQRHWNYAVGWRETHRSTMANNDAYSYDAALLELLRKYDTPTICNALEIAMV